MNSKSPWILLLLAGAVFGYILLFERHTPGTARSQEQARLLLPGLAPAEVTKVEILQSNRVIRAERSLDRWLLTDPTYPAESVVIDNWLATLSALPRYATLSARDVLAQSNGLAAFGLEPPRASVALQQGPQRLQFRVGDRTAVGDRVYLLLSGSDDVLVTDAAPLERLPQSAGDWRNPLFLDLAGLEFDRVSVRAGSRELEVQREAPQRPWRVSKPRSARADNARLAQLFQQLPDIRVARFVKDFPGPDLDAFGLLAPDVVLSFGRGTNTLLTAEFGRSPTNEPALAFARRSLYPNTIVLVPRSLPDTLSLSYTNFLDFQLIDQPLTAVDRIDVSGPTPFALRRQTNGLWLVDAGVSFLADPALVQQFLRQLQSLRIEEIVKEVVTELDLPNYGLATPAWQYLLRTEPGNTNAVLRLDFGAERAGRVYARRSDENSVYTVALDPVQALPRAGYQLRDRRLWNFTTNQVAALTITTAKHPQRFLRSPAGQWTIAPGSQGMVNTFALEELAFRLGQLWAKAWVALGDADLDRYGIPQVDQQITVELGGPNPQTLTVSLGATSPSGGPFAVTALEPGKTLFEFPFEIYHVFQEVLRSMTLRNGAAP